jgi:para-aminobenzoate synthetase component 1
MANDELLKWLFEAQKHDYAAILLSNNFADEYGKYESIAGFGAKTRFHSPSELDNFNGLALGHISYQYKNSIPNIVPTENYKESIPAFSFFEPQSAILIERTGTKRYLGDEIIFNSEIDINALQQIGDWKGTTEKKQYLDTVFKIREDIRNGVYYELNYCMQYAADAIIDPYALFYLLNKLAPSPFAAFYKIKDHFILCASPERFLQKSNKTLISQPIKGTRKRIHGKEDETIIELSKHPKDLAENIMIVDLVRNDLSRICKTGTVQVPELCKIYTFSHVHQMISTVIGELKEKNNVRDIIQSTFPMGSMTGAPKIEVMRNIDLLENFNREIYSGSIGYFFKGNFDLNVVIRSLEYSNDILKYSVGGAITYDSIGIEEYEECLTKADGIFELMNKIKGN